MYIYPLVTAYTKIFIVVIWNEKLVRTLIIIITASYPLQHIAVYNTCSFREGTGIDHLIKILNEKHVNCHLMDSEK